VLATALKLAIAGVLPSVSTVSQRTRIAFGMLLILKGSGHLKIGFKRISLELVVACLVEEPSKFQVGKSARELTLLWITMVLDLRS